jgi:hypothetical protein
MRDDKLIEAMAERLSIYMDERFGINLDEPEHYDDLASAALAALREQEPAAWLITGSRAFRDTVVTSEATADRRLSERGDDGSCKVPLYAAPQPEDAPSIQAGYKLVPA